MGGECEPAAEQVDVHLVVPIVLQQRHKQLRARPRALLGCDRTQVRGGLHLIADMRDRTRPARRIAYRCKLDCQANALMHDEEGAVVRQVRQEADR